MQVVHGFCVEHICHEQNRIRTERTGFVNLILVHKKIFSKDRLRDLLADFAEVVDVHSEVCLIREDGNRPHDWRCGIGCRGVADIFSAHRPHAG